jgi:hypothetical protein
MQQYGAKLLHELIHLRRFGFLPDGVRIWVCGTTSWYVRALLWTEGLLLLLLINGSVSSVAPRLPACALTSSRVFSRGVPTARCPGCTQYLFPHKCLTTSVRPPFGGHPLIAYATIRYAYSRLPKKGHCFRETPKTQHPVFFSRLADDKISLTMFGSVSELWNAFSHRLLRLISGTTQRLSYSRQAAKALWYASWVISSLFKS